MSIQAAVHLDVGDDHFAVGANACQGAVSQLDRSPDMVFVFSAPRYDHALVLNGVRSVAPNAIVVGSSTAGEITTNGPSSRESVCVMAISSPDIHWYAAVGQPVSKDARAAGRSAAASTLDQAKKNNDTLKAFIMLPDVLHGNGSDIVRGVLDVLGKTFPVVGGASADGFNFKQTCQYLNDEVHSDSVVGVGMSGAFSLGIGVKHGWVPIGRPMKVTRAEGSTIHELEGKPAISIYREYFGDAEAGALKNETLAKLAITYPLGMSVSGSSEMLIRDPLTVNEYGSITCAAEIPTGSMIRLMVGSREEAVRVAKEAAEFAMTQLNGKKPKAILIFNCIARYKLFGDRRGEEIRAIQEAVGRDVPLIGFYTYGEQAPLGGETRDIKRCNPDFHNETVVICAISD